MVDYLSYSFYIVFWQVSVVEYALDVIEECEDQPEGLQRLIEFQVCCESSSIWETSYPSVPLIHPT